MFNNKDCLDSWYQVIRPQIMVILDHFKGNMTIKLDLVVCTHLSLFTHIVGGCIQDYLIHLHL